jgi:hypothetical protein
MESAFAAETITAFKDGLQMGFILCVWWSENFHQK